MGKRIPSEDQLYNLWLLMERTRCRIYRARQKELMPYDLDPQQAGVLFIVHRSGNKTTPIEISRQMFREPQTITSILKTMMKKGLITRKKNPNRKNINIIGLTKKGKEAYAVAEKRYSIHWILFALSEEQQKNLQLYLEELLKRAELWMNTAHNMLDH